MGKSGDKLRVVDSKGRVVGVEGLRIADTSVIPVVMKYVLLHMLAVCFPHLLVLIGIRYEQQPSSSFSVLSRRCRRGWYFERSCDIGKTPEGDEILIAFPQMRAVDSLEFVGG